MTNTQSVLVTLLAASPAALGGLALATQDRYSLQVPGGLAWLEFKGYEDWQVISVSHNGDKVALIVGNPAMIEAYKSLSAALNSERSRPPLSAMRTQDLPELGDSIQTKRRGVIKFLGRRHQSYVKLVLNSRPGSNPFFAIRASNREDK